jgi:hypothetical protein
MSWAASTPTLAPVSEMSITTQLRRDKSLSATNLAGMRNGLRTCLRWSNDIPSASDDPRQGRGIVFFC